MTDKSRKAVPREPTVEMLRVSVENAAASHLTSSTVLCSGCLLGEVWTAMFDAAPVLATADERAALEELVALIEKHRWTCVWKSSEDEPAVERAKAVLATAPAEPPKERGPWKVIAVEDGRLAIESDDFTHDVRLYVNGDFADAQQRVAYANLVCGRLNSTTAEPPKWVPSGTTLGLIPEDWKRPKAEQSAPPNEEIAMASGTLREAARWLDTGRGRRPDGCTLRCIADVIDRLESPPSREVAALIERLRAWAASFPHSAPLRVDLESAIARLSAPVPEIEGTDEAWDTRQLGSDERYVEVAPASAEESLNRALGIPANTPLIRELRKLLVQHSNRIASPENIEGGLRKAISALVAAPVPAREWIPTGRYRHYKGELYDLLTTARLEADDRTMAVYRSVETGNIWTRPSAEFREKFTVLPPPPAADK